MRTVPETLQYALTDKSIPIKKKILIYRRYWDTVTSAYLLETTPLDITPYINALGKIKIKLDVNEADKWETSSFTLTLNNSANLFCEGKSGGLMPSHIWWGSKIVYQIYADGHESDTTAMFTGYIYSTPVLRDDGNTIDLTISSDFKALENLSAEGVCLYIYDEECTAVSGTDDKDFTTLQNGIGFIDTVKYGADFASAVTLEIDDYSVSDDNQYDKPATISLKITPTAGYKLWASYRYWHTDYPIDALVNLLLDLSDISEEDRDISRPLYPTPTVKYYQTNIYENAIKWQMKSSESVGIETAQALVLDNTVTVNGWNSETLQTSKTIKNETQLPLKGLFFADLQFQNAGTVAALYELCGDLAGNNSLVFGWYPWQITQRWGIGVREDGSIQSAPIYTSYDKICGIAIDDSNHLWVYKEVSGVVTRTDLGVLPSLSFDKIVAQKIVLSSPALGDDLSSSRYYKNIIPSVITNTGIANFISTYLQDDAETFGSMPCARFDFHITEEYFTSWGSFSCDLRQSGASADIKFYWSDSDDGVTYSAMNSINAGDEISSTKRYLRFYARTESAYDDFYYIDNLRIWSYQEGAYVALANFTDLSVADAITKLAELVAYEIGLNQDGVFFFRPRSGIESEKVFTDLELTDDIEKNIIDIDSLFNFIEVDAGDFTTIVNDETEEAARPNSTDKYGTLKRSISFNDLIPKDNIDVSGAIAQLNYDAFCVPSALVNFTAIMDASVELSDIVKITSDNVNLLPLSASSEDKEAQLPAYNVDARIVGLEYDFDKKIMSIEARTV